MTTTETVTRTLTGVRGQRYGEMLLVKQDGDALVAEVYNSFTLGDCPQERWDALDPAAIAAANGALLAVPNGPRYWLMDVIEKTGPATPDVRDFGGIAMNRAAVVHLGTDGVDRTLYRARRVARTATFSFSAGSTVYELTAGDGAAYVMQSWCTSVEPSLGEADLAGLGARLQLPEGWTYGQRRLDEDLHVMTTDEDAEVLQDDLFNSYCRRP